MARVWTGVAASALVLMQVLLVIDAATSAGPSAGPTGAGECLGAFASCGSSSRGCALFPQDCGACSGYEGPGRGYVCPDHRTCVSAGEFIGCPGVQGSVWDPTLTVAQRVAAAVAATDMADTIQELWNWAPGVYDAYIPPFNWLDDDEHGVKQPAGTSFPNGGCLGASWNVSLLRAVGAAVATEARGILNSEVADGNRGLGQNGIGVTLYAPNANLVRDPRWGRAQEVYSEDPALSGALVTAFVDGIQQRQANGSVLAIACCKHFVAYDLDDIPVTRYTFDAQLDSVNAWETYLPVFRDCITLAKGQSVMASYNSLNGVPTACDGNLLNGLLRDRWGFEGFVVGDYDAVANIVNTHKYAGSYAEAAALAWNAGMDQEGGGQVVIDAIANALNAGTLTAETVQTSFARLLRTRVQLGLFDPPTYSGYNAYSMADVGTPAHVQLAFDAAVQGTVLLKNGGAGAAAPLPVDASTVRVAVIGPQAVEGPLLQGNYAVPPNAGVVTLLEGIDARVSGRNESVTCGPLLLNTDFFIADQAGVAASSPEVCCSMCSWAPDCVAWTWYQSQCYLKDVMVAPTTSQGRVSGKPVAVASPRVSWAPGCNAVGCEDESHFAAAGKLAAGADVVVVVLGLNQTFEYETHDRTTIDLPQGQYDLVSYLRDSTSAPVVGVLIHGGAVALHGAWDELDAVLDMFYPGQEGGNALAAVLFGDANPGGREPITGYAGDWQLARPGQMDLFAGLGQTYRYFNETPAFAFGSGLSYTTFAYSNLVLPSGPVAGCDAFPIGVTVTNTGSRDGDEVVQVFARLPDATVPTARVRLVAFDRVFVPAGKSVDAKLTVPPVHLAVVYNGTATSGPGFWDPELVVEKGRVELWVGGGGVGAGGSGVDGVVGVGTAGHGCDWSAGKQQRL